METDIIKFASKLAPEVVMSSDSNVQQKIERTLISIRIKDPKDERYIASSIYYLLKDDKQKTLSKIKGFRYPLFRIRVKAEKGNAQFSRAGIMVANGRLWISTHDSMIRDALMHEGAPPLAANDTFLKSLEKMSPWLTKETIGRSFVRMDRDIHNTYQVLKDGGADALKDSESIYSQALSSILAKTKKDQPIELDFGSLPPFESISRFLGVTAAVGNQTSDGWTITIGTYTDRN